MSFFPDAVRGKSPGSPDAEKPIRFNILKIVTDDDKENTNTKGNGKINRQLITKAVKADDKIDEGEKNNQGAFDNMIDISKFMVVGFFRIKAGNEKHDEVNSEIKKREEKGGKSRAGIAVWLTLDIPVSGNFIWEERIKIETGNERDDNKEEGNEFGFKSGLDGISHRELV